MAARKLQTEIDKTLKKVSEGVEQFEDIYKKVQASTNLAHKEKQEAELKTQIKKLQRLRDQIKTWLASNEIKDKKALTDNRKLIELQMERFKACEKEMKTKAFSKEGLSAGQRLDPKEQLKRETAEFVTSMVEELSRQVEMTEAEIEQLQGGAKKSKKAAGQGAEKVAHLEELNERRNWHISRLELILRLMENGNMDPDRVQTLKEDIGYFVESNTEEDFEEDEGIYDELNLEAEEEAFGMGERDDIQSSHDSMSIADASDIASHAPPARTPAKAQARTASMNEDSEKSPTTAKTVQSAVSAAAGKPSQRKPTLDGTAQRPTGLSTANRTTSGSVPSAPQVAPSTPAASAPASRPVPTVLPPIRYSAAAASAVSASSPAAGSAPQSTPVKESSTQQQAANASVTSPPVAQAATQSLAAASGSSGTASSSAEPQSAAAVGPTTTAGKTADGAAVQSPEVAKASAPLAPVAPPTPAEAAPSPAPSHSSASRNIPSVTSVSPSLASAGAPADSASVLSPSQQAASVAPLQALEVGSQPQQQGQVQIGSSNTLAQDAGNAFRDRSGGSSDRSPSAQQSSNPSQSGDQPQTSQGEPRLPSSLADLVTSFENAKQKSMRGDNDLNAVQSILEAGYSNIPQPADAEKPKYYIPKNPFPTPHYYPQQPSPHLANPALFSKFDIDTLFYIFYYCQGTYMQYLAAQELKKQSWRFHKQYLTWFQRANEPQAITDEYEQGVYLYFDFEGSWAQRRKENFSFFYRHLEE